MKQTNEMIITAIEGVFGGLGAITCTVALVFVLVSRFYKDIVQRLILYKLVTMLVYSLSENLSLAYDDSKTYRAVVVFITHTAYYINLGFDFWLTITLYLFIVRLKELKNFKKLEPIAIITSCLPLVSAALIPFIYIDCSKHKLLIDFPHNMSTDHSYSLILYIFGYSIAGILYFIISVLVVIIFIVTIRRSRRHHQRQNDNAAESLLVTNNKWKILSKQLLPLVVYPIVNTVMAIIFYPLLVLYFNCSTFKGVFLYSLISSSGLMTGTIVIIHLCILKCRKKQRERKENERSQVAFCVVPNHYSDVFTRETVASSNARTTYKFTRTSSFMMN